MIVARTSAGSEEDEPFRGGKPIRKKRTGSPPTAKPKRKTRDQSSERLHQWKQQYKQTTNFKCVWVYKRKFALENGMKAEDTEPSAEMDKQEEESTRRKLPKLRISISKPGDDKLTSDHMDSPSSPSTNIKKYVFVKECNLTVRGRILTLTNQNKKIKRRFKVTSFTTVLMLLGNGREESKIDTPGSNIKKKYLYIRINDLVLEKESKSLLSGDGEIFHLTVAFDNLMMANNCKNLISNNVGYLTDHIFRRKYDIFNYNSNEDDPYGEHSLDKIPTHSSFLLRKNHTDSVYARPSILFCVLDSDQSDSIMFYKTHKRQQIAKDIVACRVNLLLDAPISICDVTGSKLQFGIRIKDKLVEIFVAQDETQKNLWLQHLELILNRINEPYRKENHLSRAMKRKSSLNVDDEYSSTSSTFESTDSIDELDSPKRIQRVHARSVSSSFLSHDDHEPVQQQHGNFLMIRSDTPQITVPTLGGSQLTGPQMDGPAQQNGTPIEEVPQSYDQLKAMYLQLKSQNAALKQML